MSLESSTQSDFELAEALNELAEELQHADKEMAEVRAPRSNTAEKTIQLSAKRERSEPHPSALEIAQVIKELREKEIKDRLSARERALKISKTVELIMILVRKKTGKYGKITEEMKSWAVEYAIELTDPNTPLKTYDREDFSFTTVLDDSDSGRIVAAAEEIMSRTPGSRDAYQSEIVNTLSRDIRDTKEKVRKWIEEAIAKLRDQKEESGRHFAQYGGQNPKSKKEKEPPLVQVG